MPELAVDVKALAQALVRLASEVEETHGEAARDLIDCVADRLTRQDPDIRRAVLEEAATAERTRIVMYLRSFAKRVEPKSASANNFNAAADAIETGHAFPGGNPVAAFSRSDRDPPYRLAIRKRNRAHVYEVMHETLTHVELRWKTRIALPRETFEQDYEVTEPTGPVSGT